MTILVNKTEGSGDTKYAIKESFLDIMAQY